MKMLLVITKADEIGGAQTHVLDVSKQLKELGHDVIVLVGEEGLFVDLLVKNNIDVIIENTLVRPIKPITDLKFILKLRRLIKSSKPDIVHLHSSKAGLLGRFSTFGGGCSCILTAHGWSFAEGIPSKNRFIYSWIERLSSPLLDHIITVSLHDKNLAIAKKVAPESKLTVIHNGVRYLEKKPIESIKKQKIKLIMVARFSAQKDHETLFKALANLTQLNWELDLVGKGNSLDFYKNYALKLSILDRVNFLGERDDVNELLSAADIFCLISNWEGFPISIIEAMQIGLPIIASNVGGVSEAVVHGQNGYLIERNNAEQLEKYLLELISNTSQRKSFSSQAKMSYYNNFTLDKMIDKTLIVYDKALNKI